NDPPELSESNAKIPPQLDKIVRRCLEKKPERRFQSTSDLSFALEAMTSTGYVRALAGEAGYARALAGNSGPGDAATPTDSSSGQHAGARAYPGWRARFGWIVAGMMMLVAIVLGVAYVRRPALEAEPMRLSINPPEKATLFEVPVISPDGRTLAFIAEVDGKMHLWVRPLNSMTARPLVEIRTTLEIPFWSPDSQFLAYRDRTKLKKIALTGGAPEVLCDAPIGGSGSGAWNREGVILFGSGATGIKRVAANGGAVTDVTRVDTASGDIGHNRPVFLPDGHHFLYSIRNPDPTKGGIYLTSLAGGQNRQLLSSDAQNVSVALNPADQSDGYLTFLRQGELFAQPYDFSRNQLIGNPVRIAEHLADSGRSYSVALNGTLILREQEALEQLTWFDRTGKKLGTIGPRGQYLFPKLSPDNQRLVVTMKPPARAEDLYLFELASGAVTPFTFDPHSDRTTAWSPDGSRIAWSSLRNGVTSLYQKATNGVGQEELLVATPFQKFVIDWSSDGRFILYHEDNPQTAYDIWVLPMEGERKPWVWLRTPAQELTGRFSPDGKWIAYQSRESGRAEIYLQAFVPGVPASGGKRQLSTNGGGNARWRNDGREIYYTSEDGKMMAVEITPGTELKVGAPKELFAPSGLRGNASSGYAMTRDGQRFLFVTSADDASLPPFTVVLNWMVEMKK
ncbi:MAG: PD40 domain-containing protein, partial [Blastocatellia bacterium]|nr:PD40 domain-containing protein [Blastocatellia bacterium]